MPLEEIFEENVWLEEEFSLGDDARFTRRQLDHFFGPGVTQPQFNIEPTRLELNLYNF